MVSLEEIYRALDEQKAQIIPYDFSFAKAATIACNGRYGVFLSPAATETLSGLKGCLCHECGHCATGATHRVDSPYDLVEKHEYKANRWAIERFLPFDALQAALREGFTEPWQLAEYFGLPQDMVEMALHFYTETQQKSFTETALSLDNPQAG